MNITHYIDVIEDLTRKLSSQERYQRLLDAIRQSIPCDAIALLKLQGDFLLPLAFRGLKPETQGRRFAIGQHPRLDRILNHRQLVRFDSHADIPDPYDGLVDTPDGELRVHDCMGISIYIDEQPWGVITLDAMSADQFDTVDLQQQHAAITLTRAVITAAQRIEQLEQRLSHGHEVTAELNREQGPSEVIGNSKTMRQLLKEIDTVASTPLAVLIQGETGVGKEIIARRLHLQSDRYNEPLVQINCAALPETLAESELFGHTKGAFTGATEARSGRFELAHGGTLFLDEIGEIPLALQAKLLRALQEGEIQRMGSDHPIKVDVRIIAATNRQLQEEVKAGRFRADLYHRLSVFPVTIPALRERGHDILLLAEHFLERDQQRLNIRKLVLKASAKQRLLNHVWPGNVRELEHLISRAALIAGSEQDKRDIVVIDTQHLALDQQDTATLQHAESTPIATTSMPANKASLKTAVDQFQHEHISQVLVQHNNNVAAAARALQVDRSNLLRLIKRLGIR